MEDAAAADAADTHTSNHFGVGVKPFVFNNHW